MKNKKVKKTKNKISAGQIVFQVINTLLVIGILGFYFGRMFHYKEKFELIRSDSSYEALAKVMIERTDLMSEERLFENEEDGTYVFKGANVNNYVVFCGQMFRVISIDAEGKIKLIANENVGSALLTGANSVDQTSLDQWLNVDVYALSLDLYSNILSKGDFNYSVVDDYKEIPTDNVVQKSIGLLTLDEYITAGGPNSYLNFNENYWIGNCNSDGSYYFIDENGSIGTAYSERLLENVRPVIYLNYSVKALTGDGTAENPYILYDDEILTISDAGIGSYVTYADMLWRVCTSEQGAVKLIAAETLKNEEGNVEVIFGETSTYSAKTTIGKYLNSDSLGIKNEDYLVEIEWTIGDMDEGYDYRTALEETYTGYIGLPTLADLYLNGGNEFVLSTKQVGSNYINYVIKDNLLYTAISIEKTTVRPMIAMKADINITDGDGSKENPYVLEVISHE